MSNKTASQEFTRRAETFGFEGNDPWAGSALRLLFAVPRVYGPLLQAWDRRYAGTRRSVDRLVRMGLVAYQPAIVIDTRTGSTARSESKPLCRYRATAKGARLLRDAREDTGVLFKAFPRLTAQQSVKLTALLDALCLEQPHARFGLSAPHATALAGMPDRSGRWWINHLVAGGYLVELPVRLADVREVVPEHWRVTRPLCRQIREVLSAFPTATNKTLAVELRLNRTRFLEDADVARVGVSGATDYDHDVECQRVVASLLNSPRCSADGVFAVEPRIVLQADTRKAPAPFVGQDGEAVFYQPDAELRETAIAGSVRRSVVEFERFQSRRDAWSHIERFLGWLHQRALPYESAVLRFVVDSEPRIRSYVELIEAFADNALDHPEWLPANPVTLAVSSVERVVGATDPLDDRIWFRVSLPSGADTAGVPVLHQGPSPYDDYFARGRGGQEDE